jgi:hypothetical protein
MMANRLASVRQMIPERALGGADVALNASGRAVLEDSHLGGATAH